MVKNYFKQFINALIRSYKWVIGNIQFVGMNIWKFIKNLGRWFANFWFVFCSTKSQLHIFYGYGHWWFAKKYADKRTRISKINKIVGGKRYIVYPWGEYSLIVFDNIEFEYLKRKGAFKKQMTFLNLLTHAYYFSDNKPTFNKQPKYLIIQKIKNLFKK